MSSPFLYIGASIDKEILGSSKGAPVVVHQYLEREKIKYRLSNRKVITGMTLSHGLIYFLVVTLQGRHTTDHYNRRCLSQMLRTQNIVCKLGPIRQLDDSWFWHRYRYKSRRWFSREVPMIELRYPFSDESWEPWRWMFARRHGKTFNR